MGRFCLIYQEHGLILYYVGVGVGVGVGVCVGACVCACCVDFFSAADFLSLAALEVCFSVLLSAGFDSCFRSASFFAIIYQLE